ncbi:MAG: trypsin-like peptidase domain-containing protein [Alphaproteobacteria bacterium]
MNGRNGAGACRLGRWVNAAALAALTLAGAQALAADIEWPPREGGAGAVVVPESMAQIQLSFSPLVELATPAVVNIYTSVRVGGAADGEPSTRLRDDPFFGGFFGSEDSEPAEEEPLSLGSGVIVSPDGIVVTNDHVVDGADTIVVALSDRREFVAELLGTDPSTDLAVLRIRVPGGPLTYLELGDSDRAKVGDIVLAIGNPFGVGQTVTSGIISALARTDIGISDYAFFIQTDASINPGNSGGALIAMDGRLIGINSEIITTSSGGSHGIGLAIPVNMVRSVVGALIAEGIVARPWLGVTTEDVTSAMASAVGLARPFGALVTGVAPDSPAALAGLQVGDVLMSIDGNELENGEALRFRIGTHKADDKVDLVAMRDGTVVQLSAVLALPPSVTEVAEGTPLDGQHPLAGAVVVTLTEALMNEYDLGHMRGGALVTGVQPGSPAARIGLHEGDVVVGINGREVQSVDILLRNVAEPQPEWQIAFVRDGKLLTVGIHG